MTYKIPSEGQRLAVESFRKFLDVEIRPIAARYADGFIPTERMREITQMIAEFGLPGAALRTEAGGLGLGYVTQAMLLEELMTVSVEIGLSVMINCNAAELLSDASPHLRDRYLPGLLSGKIFGCVELARPDGISGADPTTRTRRDGSHFIVDGETPWLANAFYSDFVICSAATGKTSQHILIDRREHGYSAMKTGSNGANAPSAARIVFTNIRLPVANQVGAESVGLNGAMKMSEKGRAHAGMLSVSLMRAAVERALDFARERSQFGRPITTHQLVAAKLAEMATLVDAARLMCFRVFALVDAGTPCDVEASMAKWFATEMGVKVCHDAVQLHGEQGSNKAFVIERLTRDASLVPGGSVELQKFIVARGLTGLSALQ